MTISLYLYNALNETMRQLARMTTSSRTCRFPDTDCHSIAQMQDDERQRHGAGNRCNAVINLGTLRRIAILHLVCVRRLIVVHKNSYTTMVLLFLRQNRNCLNRRKKYYTNTAYRSDLPPRTLQEPIKLINRALQRIERHHHLFGQMVMTRYPVTRRVEVLTHTSHWYVIAFGAPQLVRRGAGASLNPACAPKTVSSLGSWHA